ncbi:MAG TPA: cytochrome P450 [Acidocella sp.]|jgi:cytochrome P450|nr:cytochrome P450 [Acidocella sp.]
MAEKNIMAIKEIPVLTAAQIEADPHSVYRTYRANYPIISNAPGNYVILRHADILRLCKDPRVGMTGTAFPRKLGVSSGALFDIFQYGMLTADGEVHRRRRSPFSRTFAARVISDLRPRIRRVALELIESWISQGKVEFAEGFATPLPARVLCDLFGLSRTSIPAFTELIYEVTRFFSIGASRADILAADAAASQLRDTVERVVHSRRQRPDGDFLSTFLAAADQAGELSGEEALFQIILLMIAGTDTTRVAFVMQVFLLLSHDDQWQALCNDPSLIPAAVAEAMRYEPSVASFPRRIAEDLELDGFVLPSGSLLSLSTMSAMRDEHVFHQPDVFDIYRTDQLKRHPVFGDGPHRCLGEALAWAELEEGLAALTSRLPHLRLEQGPIVRGHTGIRRAQDMYLSWPP